MQDDTKVIDENSTSKTIAPAKRREAIEMKKIYKARS